MPEYHIQATYWFINSLMVNHCTVNNSITPELGMYYPAIYQQNDTRPNKISLSELANNLV